MTREKMEFPNTFDEFVKSYGFKDNEEVYTNGSELIPVFRVKQWLDHIEPCEDAVSRAWIREHLGEFLRGCRAERTYEEIAEDVEAYIDHAPSVTPKQRTGHWIREFNDIEGEVRFTCSSCGEFQLFETDFCPNCGAKMEGESE